MSVLLTVLLAPLLTAVLILVVRRATGWLALFGLLISTSAAALLLIGAFNGQSVEIILPGLPDMPLRIIATPLTSLLSVMVAIVSFFVVLYGTGYMSSDRQQPRFFATMLLFVAAMQTLVLAGDWILLLAAWEIIGLSSYLLIGFWYDKPKVPAAANRAFLVTRSADIGLYIAVFILIASTQNSALAATSGLGGPIANITGILLLIAAIGKSAQTPMHDWLQRAMAGPTPVSALLHSATLVAAGAILLIRTAPILPAETMLAIGIVGGITAIVTGMIALAEKDLKRMLAASTSSQYGLMLLAVGAGVPLAALLHLLAHAVMKSSLFLGAGVFQHSRKATLFSTLKGVGRDHPKIFIGFTLAAFALAGIPPLSGFFSKDTIIAASLVSSNASLLVPFVLGGTALTGAYMARAIRILWSGERQTKTLVGITTMGLGMGVLVVLAVVLGFTFPQIAELLGEHLPENPLAMVLGLVAAFSGLGLGWFIPSKRLLGPILPWAQNGFVLAGGFDVWIVRPAFFLARQSEHFEKILYKTILAIGQAGLNLGRAARFGDERGIDEMIAALVQGTIRMGGRARNLQSGLIHKEMAIAIVGTMLIFVSLFVFILTT